MKTSPRGVALLKQFENCVLTAYLDTKGRWTIGWGHTGPEVVEGLEWTQVQADSTFVLDLRWAETCINTSVRIRLSQGQFDALVSLVFNIGITAFAASTIRRLLNLGDTLGAGKQFKRWNKETLEDGTVRVNNGLTNRRALELTRYNEDF